MNIAIVDNDKLYVEKISHILSEHFPAMTIYQCLSVNELLMNKEEIDILLLDIEMPDTNGLTFAKNNILRYPNIIFVSSHSECTLDAFDANVMGFIVKNDGMEKRLVDKVKLFEERRKGQKSCEYRTVDGTIYVEDRKILYFHSEEECIYMQTSNKQVRLTSPSLTKLLVNLSDQFFLINRNDIVNLRNINTFMKKTYEIVLVNDLKFKVSERKWKLLLEAYNRLVNVG